MSDCRITTGQQSFDYGVDASRVPLIQSPANPTGLPNNALAWLVNGGTRGGGIQPRWGYKPLVRVADGSKLYQGGLMYDNSALGGNPYLLLSIGGRMIQVRVDTDNSVVDITGAFADPANVEKAYWVQGEQFAVKQAGDGTTLPLFWDGTTLRRSNGKSRNLGVTSAPFTGAAQGLNNIVTLTSPYLGDVNQVVLINDGGTIYQFLQVIPGNFYTIKNIADSNTGELINAGTPVYFPNGTLVGKVLATFAAPAIGATVNVKITPPYTGPALPTPITINGIAWEIDSTGTVAPGPSQVYLVTVSAAAAGHVFPASSTLLSVQELPAATAMVYYMDRIWYAQNKKYTAGDIISGAFGTVPYNFTDSILKVTENPLAIGGDGFAVPAQAGNIRALNYPIALDTTLGEGPLFVFTPKEIFSLVVPVSRKDWIAADSNNQPLQRVVQRINGAVSDRSIVAVNGDLFFQSLDPAIRTFNMSVRYTGSTWQNPPISNNINRLMNFQNRALMHMSSGMEFGSRVYETALPFQTTCGVASPCLAVLDTDPISTLQDQKPPVWDGPQTGLDHLQVFSGNFGGLERSFSVARSRIDGSIWVWELTNSERFDTSEDGTENRVEMWFETPAFDWSEYPKSAGGGAFQLKELDGLDLWLDRVFGEVIITVQFRPDEDQCWYDWDTVKICAARTCQESPDQPACYPVTPFSEQYRNPISFPKPTNQECSVGNNRPVTWGGKFQLKIKLLGWARVRGFQLHALSKESSPYLNMVCSNL